MEVVVSLILRCRWNTSEEMRRTKNRRVTEAGSIERDLGEEDRQLRRWRPMIHDSIVFPFDLVLRCGGGNEKEPQIDDANK